MVAWSLKLGIVTDELSNLPSSITEKYNIYIVHGFVYIDNEKFRAGVDVTTEEILQVIGKKTMKTAAPSPGEYFAVYEKIIDKYDSIISLHCSTNLSAMMESAKLGAKRVKNPEKIRIVPCGVAALGLGLVAYATAMFAQNMTNLDELIAKVNELSQRAEILGCINSFEYIRKSGRIRFKALGTMGSIIKIKPVMVMHGTKISLLYKKFSRKGSLKKLVETCVDRIDPTIEPKMIGISHLEAENDANDIIDKIQSKYPSHDIIMTGTDPMIASFTGPGLIVLSYFAKSVN